MRATVQIGASILALTTIFAMPARADVHFDPARRVFRLDGGDVTYVVGITATGRVNSIYWGASLGKDDRLAATDPEGLSSMDPGSSIAPQEYPGWGGGLFTEPTLKLAYPDGVRDVDLRYASHQIKGDTLSIELRDISRPIKVTLRYTIDPRTGIVGRSAAIRNDGGTSVRLDQAFSAAWSLPRADGYRLHYLTGRWAAEWTLQDRPITPGSTVIESRRGSTGHQSNPWFAVSRDGLSGEETGPVWFGALAWSGSWRISVDSDPAGGVRLAGGLNPFDFAYQLAPSQTLDTPVFYGGYSAKGMGGASRLFHHFQIDRILPGAPKPKMRPVLYNSWEATTFAVTEEGQIALAEKAARIGVERFVMDDGWFGARDTDKAGLGDWTVNPAKFPRGLKPLIDKVHALGMSFGLWVEPEMVNPDSDLYRAHPDWVIAMPGRPRTEERHQLVLNLARPDVRDHVLAVLDDLVSKNDIQFLKWDYNRNWSEPGWPQVAPDEQQSLYVRYIQNLYGVIAELRRRHPGLEIESCSGGGGRVDLGIMALTDEVWASDNTDPFDRLTMQDGFSYAYAPGVMMAWVTDSPNWVNDRSTSLRYRFLSSMQGSLGIGANLNSWTDTDFAEAHGLVEAYKQVRELVQRGDLYRLISPRDGSERSATFYVAPDRRRAVLFAFTHSSTKRDIAPSIQLAGLDPARRYRLRTIDAAPSPTDPVQSGAYWMQAGVDLPMKGDFKAEAKLLEAVE